jgi:hypothetical protein
MIRGSGVALAAEASVKFGVGCVGLGELIFEDDDAARRVEGGAVID